MKNTKFYLFRLIRVLPHPSAWRCVSPHAPYRTEKLWFVWKRNYQNFTQVRCQVQPHHRLDKPTNPALELEHFTSLLEPKRCTNLPTNLLIISLLELNLCHNQISKLPDELADLNSLESLDISNNSFLTLPPVVFRLRNLKRLIAKNNKIIEIDFDLLDVNKNSLELVDLRNNPLTGICIDILKEAKVNFKIEFTERPKEDWEDLEI